MSNEKKMSKKELAKRYILFIFSLFACAVGVAFTKKGELGISPTSSVANIMSMKFTEISLGYWLVIWNCTLIVGQVLILRRKFQLIQLLQVPLSFLFGYFTDFGMWLVSFFEVESYFARLAMVLIGTVLLGLGVALSVMANVIMNSAEAFIKAISDTIHKNFGNVKIAFDIICVVISVIMSLFFFDFTIVGTREGTLIAAVLTGLVVKLFIRIMGKQVESLLTK